MALYLVTGSAAFIGSNFVDYALRKHCNWRIINLVKQTYPRNLDNVKEVPARGQLIRDDVPPGQGE